MLVSVALLLAQQEVPVDFVQQVRPILVSRCIECHGPDEQEAELRLDARRHVFGPDHALWVVRPGRPAESPLFQRIALPSNHDDRMPSEGDPLTAAQIATIERWIREGAPWPEEDRDRFEVPTPPDSARPSIHAALAALRAEGAHAAPVAVGREAIEVDVSWRRSRFTDSELGLLAGLEPVLVRLDLSHTAVTPAGLRRLVRYPHLRELGVARTALDDETLQALTSLSELEVLNVHGTLITDAGLPELAKLPQLQRVHLWDTRCSEAAVARLRALRPDLSCTTGAPPRARPQGAVNATCPVTGKPIDPWLVHEHAGQRIAFCCAQCRAMFVADPAAFAEKLK